jgi:hypothetical protein
MTGRSHARRSVGAAREPRRGGTCPPARDRQLCLRTSKTRGMSEKERERLVGALAELLCDWITEHPEKLPARLRSGRGRDVEDGTRTAKERR